MFKYPTILIRNPKLPINIQTLTFQNDFYLTKGSNKKNIW